MKKEFEKRDIYQEVTDRIIAALEKNDALIWEKTWNGYGAAKNYVSNEPYTGINFLLMNFFTAHELPFYLTFNQLTERGGRIKKGSKAEQVMYFNRVYKDVNGNTISQNVAQKDEKSTSNGFIKYYNVFNVADVEGIEFDFKIDTLKPNEKINKCEQTIKKMLNSPKILCANTNRCFYNITKDIVNMPNIKFHKDSESYYSVLFHELIHSTGHQTRLNRFGNDRDNNDKKEYAYEELIAEIGSSILMSICQIENDFSKNNTHAYIQGWLKALKSNKMFVFKAAAEAQKATNFILNK